MGRRRTPLPPMMEVEVEKGGKPDGRRAYHIQEFRVAEYVPHDEEAPLELHILLAVNEFKYPLIARFQSPDTLGYLIEELIAFRQRIWPESQMPFPLDETCIAEIDELLQRKPSSLANVKDAPTV